MIAFTSVLILLILMLIYYMIKRYFTYYRLLSKLPSPKGNFILGNLEIFTGKLFEKNKPPLYETALNGFNYLLETFYEEKIGVVWLTWIPLVFVANVETVEEILSSNKLIEKSSQYEFLHIWMGTGLLTSGSSKWRSRRKLLTPSFHFRILEDFLPIMNKHAIVLTKKMLNEKNKVIDITKLISLATLDTICETAMGVSVNAQEYPESAYVKSVTRTAEIVFSRIMKPLLKKDFLFYLTEEGREMKKCVKIMKDFCFDVIYKKINEHENSNIDTLKINNDENDNNDSIFLGAKRKKIAFMDLLIEEHIKWKMDPLNVTSFTIEDISDEVNTFMFEGHDTTALAINWTIYLLGLHPEIQEKVYEEIVDTFGTEQIFEPSSEQLKKMKYLECCIKEALRLYPSVPLIGRKTTEITTIYGYTLPNDQSIIIYIYGINRDPKFFPEPEKFKPERFLNKSEVNTNPYSYVPFSAGPRNCIGQKFAMYETKLMVANVIQKLNVKSMKPREEIKISLEVITKLKEPLNVICTQR